MQITLNLLPLKQCMIFTNYTTLAIIIWTHFPVDQGILLHHGIVAEYFGGFNVSRQVKRFFFPSNLLNHYRVRNM